MTTYAVTFADTGDLVARVGHGWLNGQRLAFSAISATTGLSLHTTYFVVSRTADTFQLAATAGGAALPLTTNGTGAAYVPAVRETLLANIITAVGGEYGLPTPEDDRDLPVTIVQDTADEASANYDATLCVMPVNVARAEAATSTDRDTMRQQGHAALQSIIAAMYADETFSGYAVGIDYTGGGIQAELGKIVFAEAAFRVRYQHLRGQPAVLA
jgi:hypothetical protein